MRITALLLAFILCLTFVACGGNTVNETSSLSDSSEVQSKEESVIKITEAAVRSAETKSVGAGQAIEKLSLTPLTESSSFTVKGAVNYKWIAYDNYTVVQHFEKGVKLSDAGYLFYIELPKTAFDHEMYLEFFAEREKVEVYSGEVAYTGKDGAENELSWYSLPLGATEWTEHKIPKYKLCFGDGGEEYKGYVFIPAESLTYRYESKDLSDIAVYVKTGIETGNGEAGEGMTFNISAVMPAQNFDKTVTVAESSLGKVNLSENMVMQ